MTIRSTYVLDRETAERIRRLASEWSVSRAEVIRRSVGLAADHQATQGLSPAEVARHYASRDLPRDRAETARLIESMRAERHADYTEREPGSRR